MGQHSWTYYAWVGGCLALAFFIRYKRLGKAWRLRPGTLWVIPTIFILIAAAIYWEHPPAGIDWLWIAGGGIFGCGVGWWRAAQVEIYIDPASGELLQRSSLGALLVLGAIMAVRWLMHLAILWGDAEWHFGAILISDIFVAMAVGALGAYRIELYRRARRLRSGG